MKSSLALLFGAWSGTLRVIKGDKAKSELRALQVTCGFPAQSLTQVLHQPPCVQGRCCGTRPPPTATLMGPQLLLQALLLTAAVPCPNAKQGGVKPGRADDLPKASGALLKGGSPLTRRLPSASVTPSEGQVSLLHPKNSQPT